MSDFKRRPNVEWGIHEEGRMPTTQQACLAVLCDVRDELRKLNRLLHCDNFVRIPRVFDDIKSNTKRKTYTKKGAMK